MQKAESDVGFPPAGHSLLSLAVFFSILSVAISLDALRGGLLLRILHFLSEKEEDSLGLPPWRNLQHVKGYRLYCRRLICCDVQV